MMSFLRAWILSNHRACLEHALLDGLPDFMKQVRIPQ
jgi:hypothetical protein